MWRLICILAVLYCVESYKILGLFPYFGKSHFLVFEPLMKELAEKGHDVTVISHFPQTEPLKRYRDISLKQAGQKSVSVVDLGIIPANRIKNHIIPVIVAAESEITCSNLVHPDVQKLINSDEKFDLILVEHFNTDCFLALAHHYKIPSIGLTSHVLMPWTNARVGNIDNPAYIPNLFLDFSDKMSFLERAENTVAYVWAAVIEYFLLERPGNRAARQALGADDVPSMSEIARTESLILVNAHYSLNLPRPLVPGVIEVAGIHIRKDTKIKLPQNIEKWINESEHGVIYFSMGSMIKGHTFPEDKKRAFLRAFGRLKQRVLWKWENETMPEKPDNVMIQKWMPQFDVLCHPNVRAFISHGGLLGTTEAVHCGVPVVVMPQFGDQHANARALEASGGGVILNFGSVDEETVYNKLKTVLDPGFNKKAKELSARFRDRPMPPLETAIYWIEYVARHKGAPHMRTAAVGMPLYQYLLLDVIAFLGVISLLGTYVTYVIARCMLRMLCGKKKADKIKTK